MAKALESERRAIEAEEEKLRKRREGLTQLERAEIGKLIDKAEFKKLTYDDLTTILAAVKTHGIAEVRKRLA